jgi:protein phosphatase
LKIVIVSDIHGNFDALSALRESYDELWVLGDLVNYGPEPAQVVDDIKSKATLVVRGNHDNSIGFNQDPRCSLPYIEMAEATRRFTDSVLDSSQKDFLRSLPVHERTTRRETRFYLCHAVPSDPLFGYCEAESERWATEIEDLSADILLVGHTHVPFVRSVGRCVVVNPGSLGQPKTESPEARYAVWDDGKIELKSYAYPVELALTKVQAMPIASSLRDDLSKILRTGSNPPTKQEKENGRT